MNEHEFSNSIYEEQAHLAESELSSFVASVAKLYGPGQASLSAEDWLNELELMDSPPRSEPRNWQAVTIAASARLASRVDAASHEIARPIPVALSVFPDELYPAPQTWTEKAYPKLIHFNRLPKGGHFAAWEQPKLFSEEVRAGFRSLRSSAARADEMLARAS